RAHFHEREPAGAPRGHIAHHFHRFDSSRAREQLLELCFSRFVREVSDIQLPTHELTPLSQTRQSAPCHGALVPTIPNGSVGGFRLELSRTSGGASQERLVTPTGGTARGKIQTPIVSLRSIRSMNACADPTASSPTEADRRPEHESDDRARGDQ